MLTKGDGIFNVATLTLIDSVVISNKAVSPDMTSTDDYGGGIYNSGSLTLGQSIVTRNTADDGGGLFDEGTITPTTVTIANNIPHNCAGSGFMCP
jgi:hypothetical protein